jgi:hypothetical protein
MCDYVVIAPYFAKTLSFVLPGFRAAAPRAESSKTFFPSKRLTDEIFACPLGILHDTGARNERLRQRTRRGGVSGSETMGVGSQQLASHEQVGIHAAKEPDANRKITCITKADASRTATLVAM